MAEEKSSHDLKEESCVENATAAGDLEGNKVNHTLNATTDEDSKDYVTTKTWIVIVVLSFLYGLAWWIIPTTIFTQFHIAAYIGSPAASYWMVTIYSVGASIGFFVAGPTSDLFGRRFTMQIGSLGLALGLVISTPAKTGAQFLGGFGIAGFFSGFAFMSLACIPELIPLKFRHIGVCIADSVGFLTTVVGPVAGQYATLQGGNTWIWLYWSDAILCVVSFILICWLYKPPKHPKGVPWSEGIRGFDWIGTLIGSSGLVLILVGIAYSGYLPSNDLHVILPLCLGFPTIIVFGLWETYSKTRFKICPPSIFSANKGRDFAFPFVAMCIIGMYYFGINVLYPTMVAQLWTGPDTTMSTSLLLTLPGNLGLCAGIAILTVFGSTFSKWFGFRWAIVGALALMLIFGGLMTLVTPFNQTMMIAVTALQQLTYAYAIVAIIALLMWGVDPHDLGVGTGLAGAGRNIGGAFAQAIYTTILTNAQTSRAAQTVPQAAMQAGLSAVNAESLLRVWSQGPAAREAIPEVTADVLAAVDLAWKYSYCHAIRLTGLASLAFGLTAFGLLFLCVDPEPKMTDKIHVFLENDTQASKNEFH